MTPLAAKMASLFGHYIVFSLLSVGGLIATATDMHRYLVIEHQWMTDAQFTSSIALAQAAPGPQVLFVAVLGYNAAGVPGAMATMIGILVPTLPLVLAVSRWGINRRDSRRVRAFIAGMAPLTLGMLLSTGWVLIAPSKTNLVALGLVVATLTLNAVAKVSPVWLVSLGAVVGALAWS